MIFIGSALVLPGGCSLFFVVGMAVTAPQALFSSHDTTIRLLWMLWSVCFLVAIGGILLLYVARRLRT